MIYSFNGFDSFENLNVQESEEHNYEFLEKQSQVQQEEMLEKKQKIIIDQCPNKKSFFYRQSTQEISMDPVFFPKENHDITVQEDSYKSFEENTEYGEKLRIENNLHPKSELNVSIDFSNDLNNVKTLHIERLLDIEAEPYDTNRFKSPKYNKPLKIDPSLENSTTNH